MAILLSMEGCFLQLYALFLTVAIIGLLVHRRHSSRTGSTVEPTSVDVEKEINISYDEKQLLPYYWTPPHQLTSPNWLSQLVKDAAADLRPLNNTLVELKELIENDSVLFMLFSLMFQEVPQKAPYDRDPTGAKQIQDYNHMLRVFNHAMNRGPPWMYSTPGQQGLVGFPFSAVLDWPMATAAGTVAFIHPKINEAFKNILDEWARYLQSPDSVHVLSNGKNGWLSKQALYSMAQVASDGASKPKPFENYYICDPAQPHHGFTSWDDFFTRQFREGVRPVASQDDDSVIVSSCESSPLRIRRNVAHRDTFWLKSQPYSLVDMLAQDPLSERFAGGTVYQAFLSALSYHRWHSPISGTVVKVHHQPGTYYAENYWEGFGKTRAPVPDPRRRPQAYKNDKGDPEADPSGPNRSQGFISEIAARGVIYIDCDNPDIGLIAIVYIGIAEVSSCEFTVNAGQHVQKGEQLGMFRYGGSSYCLLFQKEVYLVFSEDADPQKRSKKYNDVNIKVNSELARVR